MRSVKKLHLTQIIELNTRNNLIKITGMKLFSRSNGSFSEIWLNAVNSNYFNYSNMQQKLMYV